MAQVGPSYGIRLRVALSITLMLVGGSCMRPTLRPTTPSAQAADIALLWQEPSDIGDRDLFYGPGGEALAPGADPTYAFVAADRSGYSPGYHVRGSDGLTWSVKLGPEAQTEVVSSRVLWAIGFHQPPIYYLPHWTLSGKVAGPQPAGRFRPVLPDRKVVGEWSWYESEFVTTRPFKALVVANVLLNNWDWKTSNNKIYEINRPDGSPQQQYVVQDLGASLGRTKFPFYLNWFPRGAMAQGTRNDLKGFESQRLIKRVKSERVEFDYHGIHKSLLDSLSIADVVWTCQLMSQLSDSQWHDAFRAAGYADDQSRRYVAKIKKKIDEGLSLGRL